MSAKWLKYTAAVVGLAVVGVAGSIGLARTGFWNPTYEEVLEKHATPPSKFVQVGDVKLHMRDEGEGPVILMLHSSMSNLRIYDAWADKLKTDYRVIRIDWPPYGLTIDPKPSRGMPGVIEMLEQFVEQQGLEKFSIVGSSSGSMISVLYAAKHPDKVEALALSTLPLIAPPPSEPTKFIQVMQYVHQNWMPNYLPKFYYKHMLGGLYGEPSRLKPETLDWYYETNNIPGGFDRVRQYWEANVKAVWSKDVGVEAAKTIKAPILLQWGERDHVLPKDRADDALKQFPNSDMTLIRYPDVSHYPMIEIPEKSGDDLKAYFDKTIKRETVAVQPAATAPVAG